MGIWNREMELIPRDELDQIKIERLQAVLNRAMDNVPFYHDIFTQNGIVPEKISSIDDLSAIPFTTRQDLVKHQPYEFFAVSLHDIRRIHTSSGTTGRPIVVGYTRNDRDHWSELISRNLCAVGIDRSDIVQVSFAYGLFSGGFGLCMGAENMGATVIPVSAGDIEQQIRVMLDYHTTCLFSTPSYAMQIINVMEKKGIRKQELSLQKGIFCAEPWSEDIRARIEDSLGIEAFDIYGLSEVMGPGVAGECEYKRGLHLWEDNFIAEIIDPVTGKVLAPGEEGELVLTTLTRESMPIIRYRTGDITALNPEPCRCGRPHVRLMRVKNSNTDLVIVRGVSIYLNDIEILLNNLLKIPVRYQLVVSRDDQGDNLEIFIEVNNRLFQDELGNYRHMETTIKHLLAGRLSFEPVVKWVEPSHFNEHEGTYRRLVDKRGNNV